jgi:prophage DNA circulation protein
MGNDPRKVSIQAVFAGETYLADYHKLEAALNERGAGELVHPIFGILNVQVVSHTVHHDEQSYDSCMISIEFIKAKADKKEVFLDAELIDGINLESVLKNPASALDLALEKLKVLDNNKYLSAINNIRTGLQNIYKYMGIGKGFIENILSPSAWAVGLIDDITNILTFDTNISAISKWRDLNNRTKNISSFFKSDDEDTPAELNDLAKTLDTAASVAVTQSVINNIQRELVENKGTSSNGYIKETSLTPDDLAVIRQQNRNTINESISYERSKINSMEAIAQVKEYKALADQVHLQIQSLIDVRPNLTKTTILVPCTMHWLSHYLYDDMSRAAEIRRLNPLIQNLSLLEKGMEVSVYAR